jgi:hypothetical protein
MFVMLSLQWTAAQGCRPFNFTAAALWSEMQNSLDWGTLAAMEE